ncbi:hypothetical protein D3C78_1916000 [compost metagenome]
MVIDGLNVMAEDGRQMGTPGKEFHGRGAKGDDGMALFDRTLEQREVDSSCSIAYGQWVVL